MFLAGVGATGLLAACGQSEVELAAELAATPDRLGVRFADGFRAPSTAVVGHGPQRFPFVAIGADGSPMFSEFAPPSIDVEVLRNGSTLLTETVAAGGVGEFIPFYALEFEPPEAGSYVARTEFSEFDVEFLVVERADSTVWQIGETLPGFDTPTFDDGRGVDPICTRPGEPCPFHEITLTEALANGRPTALLIATPGFCQTDVCGPSVEFLIEHGAGRDDINIVHQEVFASAAADQSAGEFPALAPLLEAWDVAFEPSLFVTDADGVIQGGKHFAFDNAEVAELLSLI